MAVALEVIKPHALAYLLTYRLNWPCICHEMLL